MRVFIGNSPWRRPGAFGVRAGSRWPHFEADGTPYMPFPFYMAYAGSLLAKHGHETCLVDGIAEDITETAFLDRLTAFRPDVVVLEISAPSLPVDRELARQVRARCGKDVRIAWCGAYAWGDGEDPLAASSDIDVFLRGEYEQTLLEYVEGKPITEVAGLLHRGPDGATVTNPKRTLLKNIDEHPWPDRSQLPMSHYKEAWGALPHPCLQLWASRGCPFKCDFCVWPQFMYGGRNYRARDPVDIVDEIAHCVERHGVRSFYFDDDTFNIGKDRVVKLAEEIRRRGIDLPWGAMARADTFDRATLEVMVGCGLRFIKYGVESGDQGLVDAMDKALDLRVVRETMRWTKELGVNVHLTFSFGHPGETWETARKTIEMALELDPYSLQFSIMTPFPGTELHKRAKAKGLLVVDDLSRFDGYTSAAARTETLSTTDLEQILRDANRRWRRHQVLRAVRGARWSELRFGLTHPGRAIELLRQAFLG